MSELICDKRVAAKVRGNVYKRVTRPSILFYLETVTGQDTELEVTELKML